MNLRISFMVRLLLCLVGVGLAAPILALSVAAVLLPITLSGAGYLLASLLAVSGLVLAPWKPRYALFAVLAGGLGIGLVAGARLIGGATQAEAKLRVVTLPQGKETRWVNLLVDEQDSLIFGEALFHVIGGDSDREHAQLTEALRARYAELRGDQAGFPSPFLGTYLNLQQPGAFDAVIIQPEVVRRPKTAIIFLHGYMGNVTAQCWEIAQAADEFGAVTVCPSTDWTGQWWYPKGQRILQATFEHLRKQGIEEFYLGGFSNGGYGISRLASRVSKEEGLQGLFFIDGIAEGSSIRDTGLPVLIVQGAQDERVTAAAVRPIAETIGDRATYVELEGDHFLIMKHPEAVQEAIRQWLGRMP